MKSIVPLALVALGLVSDTLASPLVRRQDDPAFCDGIVTDLLEADDYDRSLRFCSIFLQIIPKTTTLTATRTATTVTTTMPAYTSTTLLVTPATETTSLTETTKSIVTSTPSTRTLQQTITSTAYMDPYGSTIAVMKRGAEPSMVELAERAVVTPAYFRGLRKTEVRKRCACLDLVVPTYTARRTSRVTSTATSNIMRTMRTTTTLATVTVPTTATIVDTITVIAPPPLATQTSYTTVEVKGCPPGTTSTWLCPDMTGADDGSDPNFQTCAVATSDGYYGNCLYWNDDGSPAQSMLMQGDGSGESTGDSYRLATYGDDDSDDCPAWADWTCSASGPQRRSTLELAADAAHLSKRGYIPKAISHAEHVRQGRKKMPLGLKRGGKYHRSAADVRRPSPASLRRPAA